MKTKFIILSLLIGIYLNTSIAQKYSQNQKLYKNIPQKSGYLNFNTVYSYFNNTDDILLYLKEYKDSYYLPSDALKDLKFKTIKHSILGKYYIFQQYIDTIPVENSEIIVSINDNGQIFKCYHNLNNYKHIMSNTKIKKSEALDIAWQHLQVHGKLMSMPTTELCYICFGDSMLLCYKVNIETEAPFGYWGLNIDANSGEVLSVYENATTRKLFNIKFADYDGIILSREQAIQELILENQFLNNPRANSIMVVKDGTAQVFDPDPRTTLNDATLEDTDPPADFTNAYLTRTLREIDETGGTWKLDGPWVRIRDFEAPYTSPSTTTTGNWNFTRGNNAFNDAMTYFHIDQNQRYVQSLGFTGTKGIQNGSIEADADGYNGADNSHFISSTNRLAYGHGCVDDNEDTDVILHEYMHALLFDINNNYTPPSGDMGALGEGFGDYWAGSYSYGTPNGTTFNPNWVFTWDGHNNCWPGRILNNIGIQYDPTLTYTAHGRGEDDDEMWSAPLFQSMIDIINSGGNRQQMDRIVLEANFGLGANLTMRQMARSIVYTADLLYPNNIHAPKILDRFANQNYVLKDVYVNSSHSGIEDGSITNPFNTIQEGYDTVLPSGTLKINAGNYQIGNFVLNKRMSLIAEGGIITIGY